MVLYLTLCELVTVACDVIACKTKVGRMGKLYNFFFRRTSTFAVTLLVGAVFFERVFDYGMDSIWNRMNRGVSVFYIEHTNRVVMNHRSYCDLYFCVETVAAYKA